MKLVSTYKLENNLFFNEELGDKVNITIVDLSSEKEIENKDKEGNVTITYEYDCVNMLVVNNKNYITNNVDKLYQLGVKAEKNKVIDVSVSARLEALEEAVLEIAGE